MSSWITIVDQHGRIYTHNGTWGIRWNSSSNCSRVGSLAIRQRRKIMNTLTAIKLGIVGAVDIGVIVLIALKSIPANDGLTAIGVVTGSLVIALGIKNAGDAISIGKQGPMGPPGPTGACGPAGRDLTK